MQSIYLGLKTPEIITPQPKIYGNAFDEQYEIARFPKDVYQALSIYKDIL